MDKTRNKNLFSPRIEEWDLQVPGVSASFRYLPCCSPVVYEIIVISKQHSPCKTLISLYGTVLDCHIIIVLGNFPLSNNFLVHFPIQIHAFFLVFDATFLLF